MHELSIAQNIIDTVLMEAQKNKAKTVKEINIEVGELMQLDVQALSEALNLLIKGSKLEGASLIMHVKDASFSCNRCGARWDLNAAKSELEKIPDSLRIKEPDSKELPLHFLPYIYSSFIHCPKCGSSEASASVGSEDVLLRRVVME